MLPGFQDALATKYDVLSRQANAAQTSADANMISARGQAALSNANAGQVAANSASQRGLQEKQGGYYGAHANLANANAGQVAPLAQSTIGLQGHQGGYYDNVGSAAVTNAASQSDLIHEGEIPMDQANTDATRSDLGNFNFHAGTADLRPLTDQELHMIHQHLCMGGTIHAMGGMSQVPGQPTPAAQVGTQASDQVPAMLAPNEAVLNKHAADIIGRDKIAAANAIGNHMAKQERQAAPPAGKSAPGKGMIPPKGKAGPGAPAKHFAAGASNTSQPEQQGGDNSDEMKALQNFQMPSQPRPPDTYWPSNGRRDKGSMMAQASKPQNFAGGTHQVAHGKSAKTPTKIDPAAAMALLQMAKGGGGMPAPQPGGVPMPNGSPPQGNPMPMQPSP